MLIAVAQMPGVDATELLDKIAQTVDFTFFSPEALLREYVLKSELNLLESIDGLAEGNLELCKGLHEYSTERMCAGDIVTTYEYAAVSKLTCLRVLLYSHPEQVQMGSYDRDTRVSNVIAVANIKRDVGRKLTDLDVYNIANYDLVIDMSYTSMNKCAEILDKAINQYIDGTFRKQFWICTRSIRPTQCIIDIEDFESIKVTVTSDGDFYCIENNNGYFKALKDNVDIICVDEIICDTEVNPLSKGELYMIEDIYDIDYPENGYGVCRYRVDAAKILDLYLDMNPKDGIARNKQISILMSKYKTKSTNVLASYLWKQWNSWDIPYNDWSSIL